MPAVGRPTLFLAGGKLGDGEREALSALASVAEPDTVEAVLAALGEAGRVHVTAETLAELRGGFGAEARAPIAVKGRGMMSTYFLDALP